MSDEDRYFTFRQLAAYTGLSIRTLRTYVARPVDPLPCYRLPGKVLIRRSAWDAWIEQYAARGVQSDAIVSELLRAVR